MKSLYIILISIFFFVAESKSTPLPSFDDIREELVKVFKKQDSLNKLHIAQGNAHLCEYLILFNCKENKQLALTDPIWIKQIGSKPLLNSSQVTEIQTLLKNFNQSSSNPIKVYNLVLVQTFSSDNFLSPNDVRDMHFTEVPSISRFRDESLPATRERIYEDMSKGIDDLVEKTFEELQQSGSTDLVCYTYSMSIGLDCFKYDWGASLKLGTSKLEFEWYNFLKGQAATTSIQEQIKQYLEDNPTYDSNIIFTTVKQGLEVLMEALKYAHADKSTLRIATPNERSQLDARIDANRALVAPNMSKELDQVDVESISTDYIHVDISPFDIEKKCKPFAKKELNEKLTYLSLSGYELYVIVDKYNVPFTQDDIEQRATSIFNLSKLSTNPKAMLLLAVASNDGGYAKAGSWRIALVGGNGVPHLTELKSAVESASNTRQLEDLGMRIYSVYANLPKRQIVYAYAFDLRPSVLDPKLPGGYYLWEKKISLEASQTKFGCGNAIQIAVFQTEKGRPLELNDFSKRIKVKAKNGLLLEVKEKFIKGKQEARRYVMEIVRKNPEGRIQIMNTLNTFCQDYSTYFPTTYMQGNEDPNAIRDFFDGVVEFGVPFLSLLGPEAMAASWLVGSVYYSAQGRWKEASLNMLFSVAPDLLMATIPRAIEKVNLYILQNSADTYINKLASHTWDDLPASAQTFKQNINAQNYQYTVFQEGTAEHIVLYKQTGEALVAEVQGVGKYKVLKYEQNSSLQNIYTQPATNDAKAGALLQYYKGLLGNTIDEIDLTNIAAHTVITPSNTQIGGILFKGSNTPGGIVDVIIHSNGGSGYTLWINGQRKDVSQKTVAGLIKEFVPSDRIVRILSCNSVADITRLSAVLPNYELHAIDAIVRVHSDGGVSTIPLKAGATWKKIKNGAVVVNENAPTPTPPVGEKATKEYVEMMFWRKSIQKLDIGVLNTAISSVKSKYPIFDFIEFGCEYRSNFVAQELTSKGIKCKKIWAFGDLNIQSPYIANSSTSSQDPLIKKNARWNYHVAIVVEGEMNGSVTKMVIDPSISQNPMSVNDWLVSFNSKPMSEMTNFELLKNDYEIAKTTGTGNYFINKQLNAGLPMTQNTVVPRGDIHFETELGILFWSDQVGRQMPQGASTFDYALQRSVEKLGEFTEAKKMAVAATQVYEGAKSNLNDMTFFERIKFMYKYNTKIILKLRV
jgi:hypothetical protein